MIYISEKQLMPAVKKTFLALYGSQDVASDPELWKEDSGMIAITDPENDTSHVGIEEDNFTYSLGYQKYFPYVNHSVIQEELDYWKTELIETRRIEGLVTYLSQNPLSKRAIINLWQDEHRNLDISCPCTTILFFRQRGRYLDLHAHMRANNCSFLIFMDVSFLTGLQRIISDKLGLRVGTYIHFLDSIHFYKKELDIIHKQYEYIKNNKAWQTL